jgi:DMSO/TMAO reductase YedYZ molybdopterin-dependent catalytic subunit
LKHRRALTLFLLGSLAGLVALAFNFLLRLGGIAAFPPESALTAFLGVIPASIEEPMVQQFGDFAGQLGLFIATLIAAATYGVILLVYDRYGAKRAASLGIGRFEGLLALGLVPWLLFGLVLFPLGGDAFFGAASPFASSSQVWAFPLTLLLTQCVFAWVLWFGYRPSQPVPAPRRKNVFGQGIRGREASRREFIEMGVIGFFAVVGAAVGLSSLGSLFSTPVQVTGGSQPIDLQDAPAIFRDPRLASFVGSELTPVDNFYRVAIDVLDPTVAASSWSLKVDGMVNAPKSYSLQDVQALPQTSEYSTFECVSNEVNGNLISTAKWTGVKISDILADAGGVQSGSIYLVFYSVDGYSVGIPLAKAMMDDSLLAYTMNDQPLPTKHGYPLRAVIPGYYGMMSPKWINRISVVPSVYDGYWQTRGWTNNATVHTETFIAVPSASTVSLSQNGGSIIIAGYAFAGDRGISKVEVSLDNGKTWQVAELKRPLSNLAWALWAYEWQPPATGEYQIVARATDGNGSVQTSVVTDTFPNGATGYVTGLLEVTN